MIRNIIDIITLALRSLFNTSIALKSSLTSRMISDNDPPLLWALSIILKLLSRSFELSLIAMLLKDSSSDFPILISTTTLLNSSYKGPFPCSDMSTKAFSKLNPTFSIDDNCLRKSGIEFSISLALFSIFKNRIRMNEIVGMKIAKIKAIDRLTDKAIETIENRIMNAI